MTKYSEYCAMIRKCMNDQLDDKWVVVAPCHENYAHELWEVKEFLDSWDNQHPLNTMFVRLREPYMAHSGYILYSCDYRELIDWE